MPEVRKIVLTGGPCGGKTTALERVRERIQNLGYRVFLMPEMATMLASGGASVKEASPDQLLTFESNLLQVQIAMEDAFVRLAASAGQPSVIVCDRGTMDVKAYVPSLAWQAVLDENGWTEVGLRDSRYDAVVHLVTAADGAEEFYSTANNPARTETPERAREIDRRLCEAWLGHPHLRVVDNSTAFSEKVRRVIQAVCSAMGEPAHVEIERKFLVRNVPPTLPVCAQAVHIEQTYLTSPEGCEERVRRRGQHGNYTYTHTIKRPLRAGQRVEVERPVSAREYMMLLERSDPRLRTIRKVRTCFLWSSQYFELDRFIEPRPGLMILEAELDEEGQEFGLPPFVDIEREVTEDVGYSNFAISAYMG